MECVVHEMITDVAGVLLAGGKSRRMGQDKRFLSFGDRRLFEHGLSTLRSLLQYVSIVIAQDSPFLSANVPVLRDVVAHCGSLGGLYTGLRETSTPHVFVAACDMPFLNVHLIRYMIGLKEEADIIVPSWNNRIQPTHAIYSKRCVPVFEDMIRRRQVKIQDAFQHPSLTVRLMADSEVRQIDPKGRSFLNINSPADLEAARLLYDDAMRS
ncbi:MAG: molybdenum cofactor guanylyltransferase [Nitrospira sp.]|nr:molybdenum cofactor guanylyltransferase [Nitrospira sp.]